MERLGVSNESACPFINRDDGRCARQFSLSRIQQAFDVCINGHRACAIYQQLAREQQRDALERVIPITIEGRDAHRGPFRRLAV